MIEIFGTTYYVLPWSIMVFLVASFFVLMLSLFLVKKRWYVRLGVGLIGIIGVGVAIFWDVYLIGQEADRLCEEEAGLHIYKTVYAEGFAGASGIEGWSEYGFEYVEKKHKDYDAAKGGFFTKIIRYTLKNGKRHAAVVDDFKSTYALGSPSDVRVKWRREYLNIKNDDRIVRLRNFTSNRETGELLGELIYFKIYPGRVDGYLGAHIGFTFTPWLCGKKRPGAKWGMGPSTVVKATIKPINE